MPRARRDRAAIGLPESTVYQDTGCNLHSQCLTCPLPVCRYEMPPGRARVVVQAVELRRLLASGRTREQAMAEMSMSRRTFYRLQIASKRIGEAAE